MDTLTLFFNFTLDYLESVVDWALGLNFYQFIRVFWAFLFLETPRYLFANLFVLYLWLWDKPVIEPHKFPVETPLVTVVVPALNEADTIHEVVRSLREQTYPNIEIILIDDGSTDGTGEQMSRLAAHYGLRVHRMARRQGKSAAINVGLLMARGEFVVLMDSDSTLERSTVWHLVRHFEDPNVGAVSGNLTVRNHNHSVLTRLQAIEYLLSLSMDRRFKAELGILSIVPGAIGAYRRELLSNVGGLDPGPGCDSDATIRIRKLGRQIAFAQDAICRTTAPTSVFKLMKQRLRWDRNLVRNRARKHRDIFYPSFANFRLSSMISFADAFFFLALLPVLWLIYTVDMFFYFPGDYDFILLTMLVLHYISMTFRTLTGLIVCQFDYRLIPLLLVLPIYPFYRLFLKLIRLTALGQEVFFRKSYQDPFAPAQVRAQMEIY